MSSAAPPVPARPDGAPATDPGRVDVVESLYRDTDGSRPRPSALRPFRPALQPPEGSQDYSWLYRPAVAEPAAAEPPALPTSSVLAADPGTRPTAGSPAEPLVLRRRLATVLLAVALVGATLLALLLAAG